MTSECEINQYTTMAKEILTEILQGLISPSCSALVPNDICICMSVHGKGKVKRLKKLL